MIFEYPFSRTVSVARAMSDEPENLVLQLLRGLRSDMAESKADLKAEINSLRADVASDMLTQQNQILALQKQTGEQIEGLRQTVVQYHSSVVGHGFLISDLEARVRRVERHLDLSPLVDA
jgi:hypothetical protein